MNLIKIIFIKGTKLRLLLIFLYFLLSSSDQIETYHRTLSIIKIILGFLIPAIIYGIIENYKDNNTEEVKAAKRLAKSKDLSNRVKADKNLLFSPKYINLTIRDARDIWVTGGNPNNSTKPFYDEIASTNQIIKAMGGNKRLSNLSDYEKEKLFKLFALWDSKNITSKTNFQRDDSSKNNEHKNQKELAIVEEKKTEFEINKNDEKNNDTRVSESPKLKGIERIRARLNPNSVLSESKDIDITKSNNANLKGAERLKTILNPSKELPNLNKDETPMDLDIPF